MTTSIEGYIVVCEDFHGARGFYRTEADAEATAQRQTAFEKRDGGSGCTYRVVPCDLNFERAFN